MANKFDAWLQSAPAGSSHVYHTGPHLSVGNFGIDFSSQVYSAREAYERGEVELVQRRLSHGRGTRAAGLFEWLAIKRAKIKRPREWVSIEGEKVVWRSRPQRKLAA